MRVSGARTTERVPAAALDLHTPRRQLRRDGTGSEGDDEESVQHVRPRREVLVVDVDGMLHDALQKARHGDVERGHHERKAKWAGLWEAPAAALGVRGFRLARTLAREAREPR